jgi:N-dimethylarginine dimethylaminohydrolase
MTAQSETGRLRRVLMKHPREAFVSQRSIDSQWAALNFLAAPDFLCACAEFDALVRVLEDTGTEVHLLPADPQTGLDSIYTRDASVVSTRGAILCNMGKILRVGEPDAQSAPLAALGHQAFGRIEGAGNVEGGDTAWMGPRTLAVGHGYRTNATGIAQLRELLGDAVDEMVVVPLPHWHGPGDVMHLMSLISPVTPDIALVYSPLLPVPFRSWLLERGTTLVEVADEEFEHMAGNVLAVGARTVVALDGNSRTRQALEAAGIEVLTYQGREISIKGGGGPTCLTRPLLRDE